MQHTNTILAMPYATTLVSRCSSTASGSVDAKELHAALQSLGEALTMEHVELAIEEVDDNKNGEVEFDEFVQVQQGALPPTHSNKVHPAPLPRRPLCR